MPTIIFDDAFTKDERIILTKTFKSNCQYLGIEDKDFTVQVSLKDLGPKKCYAQVGRPDPDLFLVQMNTKDFNLFDATSALGHETVHMKQYMRGEMVDTLEGKECVGVHWKGKFYPDYVCNSRYFYKELPWEQEAWKHQAKMHRHAVERLSTEEQQKAHPSKSIGLVNLWKEFDDI